MPSAKKNRGREKRANRVTKTTPLKECDHGRPGPLPEGHVVLLAMKLFDTVYQQFVRNEKKGSFGQEAILAIQKDYPKALFDNENRAKMKESLLSLGTAALLSGKPKRAILFAESVVWIERFGYWVVKGGNMEQKILKGERQIRDLHGDGSRSVIRFFSKRVSCACLDKMNDETKRQAKKGHCHNCYKTFNFDTLMKCSCCLITHYCSKDCQAAAWRRHKKG